MLRAFLEPIAKQPTFNESGKGYFPCDYQDTYDLGVENGRIELAREVLKMLPLPFLRDEEDTTNGCLNSKAAEVSLYLTYLLQEMPFGLVPNFAEAVKPLMEIPIFDLTEEQADALIADCVGQLKRFFDKEITVYANESN